MVLRRSTFPGARWAANRINALRKISARQRSRTTPWSLSVAGKLCFSLPQKEADELLNPLNHQSAPRRCPFHPIMAYSMEDSACSAGCGCGGCAAYEAAEQAYTFTFPRTPVLAASSTPLAQDGLLGLTVSGVPIYVDHPDPKDPSNKRELSMSFDSCLGHISKHNHRYHHHLEVPPVCLLDTLGVATPTDKFFWRKANATNGHARFWPSKVTEPAPIIGWALDGFPIFGPYDDAGNLVRSAELGECNAVVGDGSVSYFMSVDPPYAPLCLRGSTVGSSLVSADEPAAAACPRSGQCITPFRPLFLFSPDLIAGPLGSLWEVQAWVFGVGYLLFAIPVGAWLKSRMVKPKGNDKVVKYLVMHRINLALVYARAEARKLSDPTLILRICCSKKMSEKSIKKQIKHALPRINATVLSSPTIFDQAGLCPWCRALCSSSSTRTTRTRRSPPSLSR